MFRILLSKIKSGLKLLVIAFARALEDTIGIAATLLAGTNAVSSIFGKALTNRFLLPLLLAGLGTTLLLSTIKHVLLMLIGDNTTRNHNEFSTQ